MVKEMLVGFSLGAQLAFRLVSEYEELFKSAIIVSPWLIKEEPLLSEIAELNVKQLKQLKNRFICRFTGIMNGLPPKQCKEFALQMQHVKEETASNLSGNGTIRKIGSCHLCAIFLTIKSWCHPH